MAPDRPLKMLAATVTAAVCLSAAAADPPLPDIKDAYGPLDLPPETAESPSNKLPAGLVATGFCTAAFYWIVRRRRRRRLRLQAVTSPDAPLPDESLLAREPGEFYAGLAAMLRRALGDGTASRTPREMLADVPSGPELDAARWQAFWTRAEAAEYAAAPPTDDERRADLAFATELLKRMRARNARGGGRDAV